MNTIINGDMLQELDNLKENSIDAIITDPPYELNFMGKGWDNAGVSFNKETWAKCLRVLKPGGYLLAFGGSRTFHRIACAIEDGGFEIRDTIMWLYGSGFPKSMDISKQIDKRGAVSTSWFGEYLKNTLKERNMTQSDLAKYFPSKTGGLTGCVHNWIEGKNMPTIEQFNKICEILDLPVKKMEEAEREVIGKKESGCFNNQETDRYTIGSSKALEVNITIPSTNLAKQWQGWGTALKPSFEPIIIARKPFKGSLVDNVIKWGVGGLNIDECRVPFENGEENSSIQRYNSTQQKGNNGWQHINRGANFNEDTEKSMQLGRFPANTILTYEQLTFDEVCGGFPNTKSGTAIRHNSGGYTFGGTNKKPPMEDLGYNDSGSASRYFYCAKASKKDRDEGLEEFEDGNITDGRKAISDRPYLRKETPRKNIHPTVKPTELMQYLIRLVSPKGATILDPFMGSGSTGKAVAYENKERQANYNFIGIELNKEYCDIAEARIDYVERGGNKWLKDK